MRRGGGGVCVVWSWSGNCRKVGVAGLKKKQNQRRGGGHNGAICEAVRPTKKMQNGSSEAAGNYLQ